MKKLYHCRIVVVFVILCVCSLASAHAGEELSNGQTLYVPAYSHIYSGSNEKPFLLTITMSIRNIDPAHELHLTRVDYYESQGKLIKKHVSTPVIVKPMASIRFIIPERDKSGGSGANFLVAWTSTKAINPPIVETVMIGAQGQQGISFTSRGRVVLNPE